MGEYVYPSYHHYERTSPLASSTSPIHAHSHSHSRSIYSTDDNESRVQNLQFSRHQHRYPPSPSPNIFPYPYPHHTQPHFSTPTPFLPPSPSSLQRVMSRVNRTLHRNSNARGYRVQPQHQHYPNYELEEPHSMRQKKPVKQMHLRDLSDGSEGEEEEEEGVNETVEIAQVAKSPSKVKRKPNTTTTSNSNSNSNQETEHQQQNTNVTSVLELLHTNRQKYKELMLKLTSADTRLMANKDKYNEVRNSLSGVIANVKSVGVKVPSENTEKVQTEQKETPSIVDSSTINSESTISEKIPQTSTSNSEHTTIPPLSFSTISTQTTPDLLTQVKSSQSIQTPTINEQLPPPNEQNTPSDTTKIEIKITTPRPTPTENKTPPRDHQITSEIQTNNTNTKTPRMVSEFHAIENNIKEESTQKGENNNSQTTPNSTPPISIDSNNNNNNNNTHTPHTTTTYNIFPNNIPNTIYYFTSASSSTNGAPISMVSTNYPAQKTNTPTPPNFIPFIPLSSSSLENSTNHSQYGTTQQYTFHPSTPSPSSIPLPSFPPQHTINHSFSSTLKTTPNFFDRSFLTEHHLKQDIPISPSHSQPPLSSKAYPILPTSTITIARNNTNEKESPHPIIIIPNPSYSFPSHDSILDSALKPPSSQENSINTSPSLKTKTTPHVSSPQLHPQQPLPTSVFNKSNLQSTSLSSNQVNGHGNLSLPQTHTPTLSHLGRSEIYPKTPPHQNVISTNTTFTQVPSLQSIPSNGNINNNNNKSTDNNNNNKDNNNNNNNRSTNVDNLVQNKDARLSVLEAVVIDQMKEMDHLKFLLRYVGSGVNNVGKERDLLVEKAGPIATVQQDNADVANSQQNVDKTPPQEIQKNPSVVYKSDRNEEIKNKSGSESEKNEGVSETEVTAKKIAPTNHKKKTRRPSRNPNHFQEFNHSPHNPEIQDEIEYWEEESDNSRSHYLPPHYMESYPHPHYLPPHYHQPPYPYYYPPPPYHQYPPQYSRKRDHRLPIERERSIATSSSIQPPTHSHTLSSQPQPFIKKKPLQKVPSVEYLKKEREIIEETEEYPEEYVQTEENEYSQKNDPEFYEQEEEQQQEEEGEEIVEVEDFDEEIES